VVYPVILQSNNKVSPQLSKVQWMDFRSGVRNLDAVGKLLNEPQKLLRALCVRPMGSQLVLPPAIMYLNYFIVFLAVVCIGSWFPYVLQYFPEVQQTTDLDSSMIQLVISLVLFGVLAFFMARQLVNRKGLFASYFGLIAGTVGLGLIIFWQTVIDSNVLDALNLEVDDRGYSSLYPEYLFIYGGLLMLIYLFVKRKELRRWLPAGKS
jgi:glucan phosphoethanolaminetransferase (alkaline phosphatase superfamily)